MRRVSTADARPIVVKLGKIRKPKVFAEQFFTLDGDRFAEAGWTIALFLCKLRPGWSGAVRKQSLAWFLLLWVVAGSIIHLGCSGQEWRRRLAGPTVIAQRR